MRVFDPDDLIALAGHEPNDWRRRTLLLVALLRVCAGICRAGAAMEDYPERARGDLAAVASDLDELAAEYANDADPRGPWA